VTEGELLKPFASLRDSQVTVTTNPSIQESLYPELTCFGCGHANPRGCHLRSYADGDVTVAEFNPRPEHDNRFGFVNGGIIATVLDCHGPCGRPSTGT